MNTHYAEEAETNKALRMLKERYEHQMKSQQTRILTKQNSQSHILAYRKALSALIDVKRKALSEMSAENKYPDELVRNIEKEIDHEEAHLSVHFNTTTKGISA